jgi:AraC family cel operon transcriptional repressor
MSIDPTRVIRLGPLLRPGQAVHYAEATPETLPTAMHGHDFLEVFWVTAGRGVERLADRDRSLAVGDYALVSRADRHGIDDGGGLHFRNVALPFAAWTRLQRRYGPSLPDRFAPDAPRRRGRLSSGLARRLDAAAEPLQRGHRDALALDRFLLQLDAVLDDAARDDGPPAWLAELLRRPEVRLGGVADLAAAADCSREHLARLCRQTLGQTPTQLLTTARLDHAAALLERTRRSVLDVALDSGFAHAGHFHQRFKHRFGLTPRQYRQRQQAIAPPKGR